MHRAIYKSQVLGSLDKMREGVENIILQREPRRVTVVALYDYQLKGELLENTIEHDRIS